MSFEPRDPFRFGLSWEHSADIAADDTGDDMEVGNNNNASPNDCTTVNVAAANNVAFLGYNEEPNHGGVGLEGYSSSAEFGVGALGVCGAGVGVYGMSQSGLGVVGRVMGKSEVDPEPLETLAPQIGVFGQAVGGVGIRGHGGEFKARSPSDEAAPRTIGGIFSAGELRDAHIPGATGMHEVSFTPVAQMQIIPSQTDTLPSDGRLGDLFLALRGDLPARLFLCTKLSGATPMWQEVQMQSTFIPSGSSI